MAMTYEEAREMMKTARNGRRRLENNTWLESRYPERGTSPEDYRDWGPQSYAIRLHTTDVVTLHPDGSYTLNSGGWRTVTTKDRINRYAPVSVASDRGAWYVYPNRGDWNTRCPFADGMRIIPNSYMGHRLEARQYGTAVGESLREDPGLPRSPQEVETLRRMATRAAHAGRLALAREAVNGWRVEGAGLDETAIRRDLLRQIRTYVDGFASWAIKNGLPDPGPGDCWGCTMTVAQPTKPGKAPWGQDKVTKPGTDMPLGVDHLFEHFRERYYVPSLLWRAEQRRGDPAFCYRMIQAEVARGHARVLKGDLHTYFKTLMPALVAAKMGVSHVTD